MDETSGPHTLIDLFPKVLDVSTTEGSRSIRTGEIVDPYRRH